MKKLNCILLIDDSEADNFFHAQVIQQVNCAEKIVIRETGEEAIEYLTTVEDGQYPQPELIFLDINMPVMNGWEFLEAYKTLVPAQKGQIIIIMLTTSLNPDDHERAMNNQDVNGFLNKPLNKDSLQEILDQHFDL